MTTAAATPDLTSYDWIVINTSAGKDSQAMLDHLVTLADAAGVRDRLVAVHADLGRVEWAGTAELAEAQAAAYGVRFIKVSRPQGDLLDQVIERRLALDAKGQFDAPAWPSSAARYCTSDHKRGQIYKVLTALVRESNLGRQARILNCMGLRAQESPARAAKVPFTFDKSASNGKRHVDTWLPILEWTVEQVWSTIHRSGVAYHPAYDAGMPRLSCCFCVLASRSALVLAARLNPTLAQEYVATEIMVRSTFQHGTSMADIVAEAAAIEGEVLVEDWAA